MVTTPGPQPEKSNVQYAPATSASSGSSNNPSAGATSSRFSAMIRTFPRSGCSRSSSPPVPPPVQVASKMAAAFEAILGLNPNTPTEPPASTPEIPAPALTALTIAPSARPSKSMVDAALANAVATVANARPIVDNKSKVLRPKRTSATMFASLGNRFHSRDRIGPHISRAPVSDSFPVVFLHRTDQKLEQAQFLKPNVGPRQPFAQVDPGSESEHLLSPPCAEGRVPGEELQAPPAERGRSPQQPMRCLEDERRGQDWQTGT